MNEIQKSEQVAKNITKPESRFKGYTLEEIRYQRALVTLQKEFCRNKLNRNLKNLHKSNPFSTAASASGSIPGKLSLLAGKLLTGLNYIDYAMIGFSMFGTVRKVMSLFHRKKK
ncbi:MAG: hypothetical protein K2G52_13105 [Muribaculaceae bacterium]|nr:hypothetical protein [Muribaculaceae bacterium]